MTTRNLRTIFDPKRIAVVGASDVPHAPGSIALHNLLEERGDRVIYPVTPLRESVHGVQAYPSVAAVPKLPDLAVICAEAAAVPDLLVQCGEAGIPGAVILSTDSREVGREGQVLKSQVRGVARRFPRMRILGPNSFGIVIPRLGLNASLAKGLPKQGHVAFVSQSQALSISTLDWALKEHIGFSHFMSIGDGVDMNFSDIMDFLGGDPWTQALILYVISLEDVREFMSAARAFARNKPIVAYRSGRFAETTEGTLLHTGQMAGEDAVYDAALRRAGIVRVAAVDDIFDCAELLARQHTPQGDRLSIITNAGEPAGVAADALLDRHGALASLTPATSAELAQLALSHYPHSNPAHLSRSATPEEYAQATRLILHDPHVDAAMVILVPRGSTDPTAVAQAVSEAAAESSKPVLAAWMGGQTVQAGIQVFNESGVPVYTAPEKAVRAFMYLVSYARNRQSLYETPRDIPLSFTPRCGRLRSVILRQQDELLSERISKALLASYGIPVTKPYPANSADEAVEKARHLGYPVVLKLRSPQITYKADVQGVAINLTTETGVRSHYARLIANARQHRPDATIEGVTVEKMIVAPNGVELILGARRDRNFGAVLMVGAGGIATEIIDDRSLELPPLNERLARRMLESLKSWPLLRGYRNKPGVQVDHVIDILMRLSRLVADHPEICELDINPLLATPDGAVALDARIRIDRCEVAHPSRPYAHFAIRPYPQELTQRMTLRDGVSILLRPIRPEDVPAWQGLLTRCSDESIHCRFRALLKRTAHEVATRYCFIDYDREMTIVAEVEAAPRCTLVGAVNFFMEPGGDAAEYAILVADDWQRKGLGTTLTRYCLELAEDWHLDHVYALTTPDNIRMLSLLEKLGFCIQRRDEDEIMLNRSLRSDADTVCGQ